jgi:type IV secretory pathway TrbL component
VRPHIAVRPSPARVVLVGALAAIALTGCGQSSSKGFSSPPPGVAAATWNDYCTQSASLTSAIQKALNGQLSAASMAPLLNGIEQAIDKDAAAGTNQTITTQFQALATAIDGVKNNISSAIEPDYTSITSTRAGIRTCNK